MKMKKMYERPMMEAVEANLDCPILAGSGPETNDAQAEDGVWNGLKNTESVDSQVEDGVWNGL